MEVTHTVKDIMPMEIKGKDIMVEELMEANTNKKYTIVKTYNNAK